MARVGPPLAPYGRWMLRNEAAQRWLRQMVCP